MITNSLHKNISEFINNHNIFTLATIGKEDPHCAICFYEYSENIKSIMFKSSKDTEHILNAVKNNHVGGTILSSETDVAKLKGLQFKGFIHEYNHEYYNELRKKYYIRFPFALIIPGDLWIIELTKIKFTDNSLGFARKINWEKTTQN